MPSISPKKINTFIVTNGCKCRKNRLSMCKCRAVWGWTQKYIFFVPLKKASKKRVGGRQALALALTKIGVFSKKENQMQNVLKRKNMQKYFCDIFGRVFVWNLDIFPDIFINFFFFWYAYRKIIFFVLQKSVALGVGGGGLVHNLYFFLRLP